MFFSVDMLYKLPPRSRARGGGTTPHAVLDWLCDKILQGGLGEGENMILESVKGPVLISLFSSYIRLYGYRFSKEDHVLFIKLTYELLIVTHMDSQLLTGFSHLLLKLLK